MTEAIDTTTSAGPNGDANRWKLRRARVTRVIIDIEPTHEGLGQNRSPPRGASLIRVIQSKENPNRFTGQQGTVSVAARQSAMIGAIQANGRVPAQPGQGERLLAREHVFKILAVIQMAALVFLF